MKASSRAAQTGRRIKHMSQAATTAEGVGASSGLGPGVGTAAAGVGRLKRGSVTRSPSVWKDFATLTRRRDVTHHPYSIHQQTVDEVFAVVVDGARWADWNPTVRASRRLDAGPIGNGARFEWDLRGVGKVIQEFQEFEPSTRVRFVTHVKTLGSGHLFCFSTRGDGTRIGHEVEIRPEGVFVLFALMMGLIGRKDLRDTANALQAYLER
jgi:hypothetical protein